MRTLLSRLRAPLLQRAAALGVRNIRVTAHVPKQLDDARTDTSSDPVEPTTTTAFFVKLVQRQDEQTHILRSEMQAGFASQYQKVETLRSEMQQQGKELRTEMQAGFQRIESAIQGVNQESEKRTNSAKGWIWGLFLTSGAAFTSLLYLLHEEQRHQREAIYELRRGHPEFSVASPGSRKR